MKTICSLRLWVLVAFMATGSGAVVPEQRLMAGDRPDSLFQLALEHYDENRPVEARWVFEQLSRKLGQSSVWQAASQLMLARTLYRLGDLPGAENAAGPLIELPAPGVLPDDVTQMRRTYQPHAEYLRAMIDWRRHDRRETFRHCYRVATNPDSEARLAEDARVLAQAVIAQADSAELGALDGPIRDFFLNVRQLNRALGLYHGGQLIAARVTAEALERSSPDTYYSRELSLLISEIRRAESSEIRMAVIAPLAGPDSAAGMEIINGVRFALDEQRSPLVSRPIIRSVRGQIETIGVVQELCRNPSIRAIIGPLTTQNAIAAAAVANAHDMVLLTPTATGDGISAIGPNVFQANSTPAAQGRLLASVAMDSLHARTVATLSSVSPDDKAMATAFADEVRKKGGEVFVQEWFFPNTEDWRPQLMQIRTAGLMRDTTLKEETRQKLALGEPTELDTMRLMREVTTIDVMLVSSASQEDLIKLAAQIPTQKIWARVLGGVVWGSQNVRQQAGEDAEGIIFTTNYGAAGTRQFEDRYRLVRRQQPNIVTALSYDAASLVIRSVHDGARTRAQVREMLASQQNWPGASGRITFGPDGSNTEAVVRIVRGGTVRAVFDWSHLVRPSHWGVAAQVVDGDAESEGEEGAENAEDAEE